MMAYILKCAEGRANNPVTKDNVESFRRWMDEDPHVMNHLLWEFVNLNLTGAAHEIFSNTGQSNGLEVLRKIHALIFVAIERRQDELYEKINNPKLAANASEVAGALENWNTNQRLHRGCGGVAL